MKHTVLFFLFVTGSVLSSNAQDIGQCPCCTREHNQFSFWIGEWNVYDTLGNKVGENSIIADQNNCVLIEKWVSPTSTGTSINYYDRNDKTWNQVWIDNVGNPLILKGSYSDGKMSMTSNLTKGLKVDFYYNRITWEKREDGSVVQNWSILDKEYKHLATQFVGIYRRK